MNFDFKDNDFLEEFEDIVPRSSTLYWAFFNKSIVKSSAKFKSYSGSPELTIS